MTPALPCHHTKKNTHNYLRQQRRQPHVAGGGRQRHRTRQLMPAQQLQQAGRHLPASPRRRRPATGQAAAITAEGALN